MDANVAITRTPYYPGYAEVGGPDRPGDDLIVRVDDVPVGATYWCGAKPKGQRWGSWGPTGSSMAYPTREAAEAAQVEAYLELMAMRGGAPQSYCVEVALVGGPRFLVQVEALTWAHAKEVAATTWPLANGVRVLDDDDKVSELTPATADEVTAGIARRRADAWERMRMVLTERARKAYKDRRREERCGFHRTSTGAWYGTPQTGADDRRFSKAELPDDAFVPNADAVWGVVDRVSQWGWKDALSLLQVVRKHPVDRSWWFGRDVVVQVSRAANAAGDLRRADLEGLRRTVKKLRLAITPEQAARKPGEYSRETSRWDDAWEIVATAATAYLVADRGELSDEAYDAATYQWRVAFPDDPVPARPGCEVGMGAVDA